MQSSSRNPIFSSLRGASSCSELRTSSGLRLLNRAGPWLKPMGLKRAGWRHVRK